MNLRPTIFGPMFITSLMLAISWTATAQLNRRLPFLSGPEQPDSSNADMPPAIMRRGATLRRTTVENSMRESNRPVDGDAFTNRASTDQDTLDPITIPHWSGSFIYHGLEYKYTMVGTDPKHGSAATVIPAVLIPLRFLFADGSVYDASSDIVDGQIPIQAILNSPIFQNHEYVISGTNVGNTQYGDAFQRANGTDRLDTTHNSNVNTAEMLDKKSSAGVGTYGIKITNSDTGEVVLQGKFKVNKFIRPFKTGNEFEFYVEHDWLLPIGYVGFDQNIGFDGIRPVEVSIWLKDKIDRSELEARLFYKGQQIATTANRDGMVSTSDAEERTTEYSMNSRDLHDWKLWHFEWMKTFLYQNGITSNYDNFPDAFYAEKNPGEYTVKVYRKGVQVREAKFTVGPDGRLVDGGYAKPIFLTKYRVIVPVKIMGPEKWNASSWKTDAFYGNPLTGFSVP